jgi:dihydroorotate dehydrogenase electron transfer subunit
MSRESTMAPPTAKWVEVEGGVVRNELLPGKRHHYAVVELPASFPDPAPGQFAMLGPSPSPPGLLLKRPMSVARAWRAADKLYLGFLYTVVGAGTQALARARERWTVIGPLGRGFPDAEGPRVLVAGGRGVAPLVLLAEECAKRGEPVAFLNGARNAAELIAPEDLGASAFAPGSILLETTEDGSRGRAGRVLDTLDDPRVRAMVAEPGAAFYSCGPHGLLEAVGLAARARNAAAWVALEAHMACGTGICRSCVIPRAAGAPVPAEASNATFLLACLDGPCVGADTVDWRNAP